MAFPALALSASTRVTAADRRRDATARALGQCCPLRERVARAGRRASAWLLAGQLTLALAGCYGAPAQLPDASAGRKNEPAPAPGSAAPAAGVTGAGVSVGVAQAANLPAASVALAQATGRLYDGDYLKAIQEFAGMLTTYPGTLEAAEAAFRLGEASFADDQFAAAADYLRAFLQAHPGHPRSSAAQLLLGRALERLGDGGAAVAAYRQYEALAGHDVPLGDVLHLRAANIYFGAGRVADGWAELSLAVQAADRSGSASAKIRAYDALGARYLEAGNRAQAAAAYDVALESMVAAQRPARELAAAAWRLIGLYQSLDQRDAANAMRWRIVLEWPRTSTALQAMNDLGATSVPAFNRGLINYANRRWQPAVDAFTWYILDGAPDGRLDEARFYRAVALTRMGDQFALDALELLVSRHPHSQWAAEALWEAGHLLLRQGDRPAAMERFERLAVLYPDSPRRGEALFWLGRSLPELGQVAAGRRYLEAAATTGYEDYYTFRARAALRLPSPSPKALVDQRDIRPEERFVWQHWLAAHGRSEAEQAERRAQVEHDARFRRGTALLEAGFTAEAEQEFRELLEAFGNDPVAVEHVAVHVREHGVFPFSVTLGHRLLDTVRQMGEASFLNAPRVVQKLVLPLAYLGLVAPAAQAERVDPLLLLGLIKQESWFEPRANSSANARGLTQFIQSTARSVAADLKWPNWQWDDMFKPYVSVPFGAHYLGTLTRDFRGNYFFALAGYNGGPGNVLRWAKGDWNREIDLFVEEIAYAETRGYVKAVTANYELYKAVYYR